MSDATTHIAAWQAAGLIDGPTAERLRAAGSADAAAADGAAAAADARAADARAADAAAAKGTVVDEQAALADMTRGDSTHAPRSAAAAMFGPSVTISEVFGYLGGGFLLAAWSSFMARAAGSSGESNEVVLGVMAVIAAAALAVIGLALRTRSERASRAAGVAFLVATAYVGAAAASFAVAAGIEWPVIGLVVSSTALIIAITLRTLHPAVLTQVGVLAWLTALAASLLTWVEDAFFADALSDPGSASGPDPIVLVIGSAAWWLATAVVIALIGLREADIGARDDDPAASRRAGLSRFWAGLMAVIGLANAVRMSVVTETFETERVLEPWIGILALLILSGVLVERAFRRDATSFIYAAALGLIVALTDLNLSYLSADTEVALLIEGVILLGVGVAADRLRRRVGVADVQPPLDPPVAEVAGEAV